MVYKNLFKVKLFKEERDCHPESQHVPKVKASSDKDFNKINKDETCEDFFGPQKNKKGNKYRNFKPY